MTAEPSLPGGVHESLSWPSIAVGSTAICGGDMTSGILSGVTGADAALGSLSPTRFTATTVNV